MPDGLTGSTSDRLHALLGVKQTRPPEHSVALRVAVLGAVMTGVLALILQGAVTGASAALAPPALLIAYWVSYRRRGANNVYLKLTLSACGATAMWSFVGEIGDLDFEEARSSLALIFLWVQILHGFDLPARRDLYFSLASSLVLMLVAAPPTQDLGFGLLLVVYAAFAITALVLAHRSEIADGTNPGAAGPPRARWVSWQDIARAGAATLVAGAVLFLLLPQPSGIKAFALPFTLGSRAGSPSFGGISNPGFTSAPGARSSGTSYYGFSNRMDLRVRGDLSDEVVMRVRASAGALWRGMIFDTYDGTTWTGALDEPTALPGGPYYYPRPWGELGRRVQITQTFHIEAEQPSAIFAAATPERIWTSSELSVDELGVLRTDSTLPAGTVYSVVSSKGVATAEQLRALPHFPMPPHLERYLQLPAGLPDRVRELARKVTASAINDYERVKAIEAYLRANYHYSLDSPVPPDGQDAVDHFLFDAKVGFCEQFASATTVMLRSLGIPARVATGYTPGTRNPLTGMYEVKGSNAHAWIEVFFPGYGWYEFDPTLDVPEAAATSIADTIPIVGLVRLVAGHLLDLAPRSLWFVVAAPGALLLVALLRRGRLHRARTGGPKQHQAPVGPVTRAWRLFEGALERHGTARHESETAAELVRRVRRLHGKDAGAAVAAFERERYGATPPAPADERKAVAALEQLAGALETGPADQ